MNLFAKPFAPLLLLISLLSACGGGAGKPAAGPGPGGAMPPPEVDVITVGRGSATLTQDLAGRLQAYRTAQVRARGLALPPRPAACSVPHRKAAATYY